MSGLFEQKLREIVAGLDPDSDQPSHANRLYSFMSHSPELARLGVELVVDHLPYVDNRNLVRVIWRATVLHQHQGQDMTQSAFKVLGWVDQMGHETMAELVYGESVSWRERDEHLCHGLALFMDWCDKHQRDGRAKDVLNEMIHLVIGTANREQSQAQDLLDRVRNYYTPADLISPDGGPRRLPWIWSWMNSCYNQQTQEGVGQVALEWMVRWGVDLDAPNEDGQAPLEYVLDKVVGTMAGDPRLEHALDSLVAHGADWQRAMSGGAGERQARLMRCSRVRSYLLEQVVATDRKSETPGVPRL